MSMDSRHTDADATRLRRLLRHAVADVTPLRRHRDFRLLFAGQTLTMFGSAITAVAVPYQVFALTHSSLVVGALSLAELAPLLFTALIGGALADALDRRRLVLVTEIGLGLCSVLLVVNASLRHPQLWVLFLLAVAVGALAGFQRPSLDALLPRLVDQDELAAAGALTGIRGNASMIAGPAIGGVLIAAAGVPFTYGVDVATFAASLVALSLMKAVPPPPDAAAPSLRGIVEGFRYATSRPELVGTYGIDMVAMFFGMPLALFPALAERFGGASALGVLYAAPAVGALLAGLTSGWASRVRRHGAAVIVAASGWGLAIVALGFAPNLTLALVALALAGAADMVSGIFRMTIWNETIPDALRGRLAGIEQVSYSSGPLLGNFEAGAVAALTSVRTSIVSGGVFSIVGALAVAVALPGFRRYRGRPSTVGQITPSAAPARS
jgi:MFS family permease